jgi:XTP/dITP diphosphohydrolase
MAAGEARGRVLLATGNAGKVRELLALLPGIDAASLRDVAPMELDEPGEDYATNAAAKALAASRATGMVTLADDSGLEVDALGGAPGWRSARFAGAHGDDAANRARLLAVLQGVPEGARRARFRCAVALADARGPLGERALLAFGECEGSIALAPRGAGGFGYDPAFIPDDTGPDDQRTMAELAPDEKNAISHRGRAARALATHLGVEARP